MRHLTIAAALAGSVAACSNEPAPVICDGSAGLRLAIQVHGGGPIPEDGGQVLTENGFGYFLVDGACNYYLDWGPKRFSDVKTGTLDDPDHYADGLRLAEYDGQQFSGGVSDASTTTIRIGDRTLSCTACEDGPTPGWVRDAMAFMSEALPELYARSESVGGGQRLVVVDHLGPAQEPMHEWPIPDLDPATLAITVEEASVLEPGSGILLEGDHADAMRELRRRLSMAQRPPQAGYVWYTADEQPPEYRVYPRDVIPWEDERGLIDFGFE